MGKLRRRFMQAFTGVFRNVETGLCPDRQESMNIVLANDTQLPFLKQNINAQNAVQQYPLGCRLQVGERVFRYAHIRAAGAIGQRGRLAVCTDAGLNRAANLGAIVAGAYTVNWTVVGANVVANQFRNGYILMQGGFVHKISNNTAGNVAAVIVLTLYEPFSAIEALPAGRYGLLLENPYANVDIYTNAGVGRGMGVYVTDYTNNVFVWIQTWGPCGVIAQANDIGNAIQEITITMNIVATEEVLPHVGVVGRDGLQVLGEVFSGGTTVSWDNENFINVWLKIDP